MIVDIVRYDKTKLERELDGIYGYKPRSIYEDITDTYIDAMFMYCTMDIKIRTDLVEPQIYKVQGYEIEIIN